MTESTQCTRVHVKPAEGREVRMPERNFAAMPAEGMEVPRNVYWQRRIAVGDVTVVAAHAPADAAENNPAKPTKGVKAP